MDKRNYGNYHFTWKDWLEYIIRISVKGIAIGYLFYDSYKVCVFLIPFFYMDYKKIKEEKLIQQKKELTLQFKSMMEALVTSLAAGYSLEHAFSDARKDLMYIYEKDAMIFEELDDIISGLKINIPLEELLKDFGERSRIEDIDNFANVVMAAKKSGGNLIKIIEKTVRNISEKIRIEQEMDTMIAAKKFEERIMMVMPYGILFYLRMSNGEFLEVLYHNALGMILMTIFLLGVYAAGWWASKIMEIPV